MCLLASALPPAPAPAPAPALAERQKRRNRVLQVMQLWKQLLLGFPQRPALILPYLTLPYLTPSCLNLTSPHLTSHSRIRTFHVHRLPAACLTPTTSARHPPLQASSDLLLIDRCFDCPRAPSNRPTPLATTCSLPESTPFFQLIEDRSTLRLPQLPLPSSSSFPTSAD